MSQEILTRWGKILASRTGGAISSPSGEILRTWADLDEEAKSFEVRLSGQRGAVALQTGNHPAFPALVLACLRAGRTIGLFDPGLCGSSRLCIEKELGISLRVISTDNKIAFEPLEAADEIPPESGACLYKLTSGTTARPKAIGFTPGQLVADCDNVCETMGIRHDDLNFGIVPFAHSYGFSNLVTPLLCRGVPLVVATDALPRAIGRALQLARATVLPAVPALFRGLLALEQLPEPVRLCISAGAPLDPGVASEFFTRFGRKIHTFYGATECGGICYDDTQEISRRIGFVGKPLQGVEIEIKEASGAGTILVHSGAVGIGVDGVQGRFQPADLLVREPEGFVIVGRESDLLNVAGRKVNPIEIEGVLIEYPGVEEVVVCGVEDPVRGCEICALIASAAPPGIPALRRHCAERLPAWKVPRRFVLAAEIPRNARGKISRTEIAGRFF